MNQNHEAVSLTASILRAVFGAKECSNPIPKTSDFNKNPKSIPTENYSTSDFESRREETPPFPKKSNVTKYMDGPFSFPDVQVIVDRDMLSISLILDTGAN